MCVATSTMSVLHTAIAVLSIVVITIYYVSKRKYNYWAKRKVPFVEPKAFFGNYMDYIMMKEYPGKVARDLCLQFPNEPFVGSFYGTEPALLVQDPEIIKLVLTRDFYYFNGREVSNHVNKEVITQNMFFNSGNNWRMLRHNLTPLFTSAKMRNMFPLVTDCSHMLEDMLEREAGEGAVLEMRGLAAQFTMECICSCVFGINANAMTDTPNNPFKAMARVIFDNSTFRGLKFITRCIWPTIFYGLGFQIFPSTIANFFSKVLNDVSMERKFEPSSRNDLVDMLLQLKKKKYLSVDSIPEMKTGEVQTMTREMKDDFLVSQCILFFGAGFETTSTTIGFTLYELAKNQAAQRRVMDEVDDYLHKHGNKVEFECSKDLPYLNACAYEALRLYPIFGILARETMENYTFPTGLQIDKGTRIHIPLYHLHRNPVTFPDPEVYRPERFLPGQETIDPYMYFPYGGGPRVCIGSRFANMMLMTGLVTFFKRYRVEMADETPKTIELDPRSIIVQPTTGIPLRVIQRDGWAERMYQRDR